MGLLDGKRILVTGVLTDSSIAFHVARVAQEQGATVVLTGFGRLTLVERIAKRLPDPPPVLELDVTNQEHLDSLADRVREHVDGLDGVLHGIANAPQAALGGNFLATDWQDVSAAMHVSTYSLKALAMATLPLMKENGGSLVGLDFDARLSWPAFDWMGVAKGRPRVMLPLPGALSRPVPDQGQPGRGRPAADDGDALYPGGRAVRVAVERQGSARLGPEQRCSGSARVRGPAL